MVKNEICLGGAHKQNAPTYSMSRIGAVYC